MSDICGNGASQAFLLGSTQECESKHLKLSPSAGDSTAGMQTGPALAVYLAPQRFLLLMLCVKPVPRIGVGPSLLC